MPAGGDGGERKPPREPIARAPSPWGPGAPGARKPILPRITLSSETEVRRLFGLAALLGLLVVYMVLARQDVGPTSRADGPDAADVDSETAAVDSSSRPVLWSGVLDDAVDRLPLDSLDRSEPWKGILWHLKGLTVAEVSTRAETISARDLVRFPGRYRGRFVRATGVLIQPLAIRRIPRNGAEYEDAWRGILVDPWDDQSGFAFDLFEKPPADFEARKQPLAVEGIFCQLVTYSTRRGDRAIPYIAAKSIVSVEGERVPMVGSSNILISVAICLAILPFVGFAVSAFTKGREDRSLIAAVEKARSRPRPVRPKPPARAPGEGPPTGSPPPAPTDPGLQLPPPPPEATDPKPPPA